MDEENTSAGRGREPVMLLLDQDCLMILKDYQRKYQIFETDFDSYQSSSQKTKFNSNTFHLSLPTSPFLKDQIPSTSPPIIIIIVMLTLLIISLIHSSFTQNSPLNIRGDQVQLIGFVPNTTSPIVNVTFRFPISGTYNIVFRFRRVGLTGNDSYIYLDFNATDPNQVTANEVRFFQGKLQNQTSANEILFLRQFVNAESYDEFRMFSNQSTEFWGKNFVYYLDVYMNPTEDLSSFEKYSSSYFHTFLSPSQKHILLPRFRTNDTMVVNNTEYKIDLFTGGMSHDGNSVYFIGLIIQHNYTSNIANMWAGFSFSSSHINRDMITFRYSVLGIEINDTFSLLGMAPFNDLSVNINGINNVETVSSEQRDKHSVVLVRRLYDTQDKEGDEVITAKLNQQFCLVLYNRRPGDSIAIQNSEIHNYMKCMSPDIGLMGDRAPRIIVFIMSVLFLSV